MKFGGHPLGVTKQHHQKALFGLYVVKQTSLKETQTFKLNPTKISKTSEQNIVISFCPPLCLLQLVLPSPFSMADIFQLLETVLCKIETLKTLEQC